MAIVRLHNISVTRGGGAAVRPGLASRLMGRYLPAAVPRRRGFEIRNLTLTVPEGRTLVVLGPSGCGKSTLLRIIAGLEAPDSGTVLFNGRDVASVRPGDRRIGMLFQSYALYPHLSSERNITSWFYFRKRTPEMDALKAQKFRRTSELLDVEISYLLDRKPSRLSGGEKQRVALGRCITRDPQLFLLDEPFSNLDAKLRSKYRLHLRMLLREFNITTVYVTHDQQEAVLLGDIVAVMRMETEEACNVGTLEQVGPIRELYEHPWSVFVAEFLNLHADLPPITLLPGGLLSPDAGHVQVGVRPEDLEVRDDAAEQPHALPARVLDITEDPLRQHRVATLEIAGRPVVAQLGLTPPLAPGQTVPVRMRRYHVFDAQSGITARVPAGLRERLGERVA